MALRQRLPALPVSGSETVGKEGSTMPRFGVVVPVSATEKAKADGEARAKREAFRAAAREQAKARAVAAEKTELARQGLKVSLSALLYEALKD